MIGQVQREEELKQVQRAYLSAWAGLLRLMVANHVVGSLIVRPALAGVLTPTTLSALYGHNTVRLKYGIVIVCVDSGADQAFLVAQPRWQGSLRSPEERRTAPIDREVGTRDVNGTVAGVGDLYRISHTSLNDRWDVNTERDVIYVKHLKLGGASLFSEFAHADLGRRDGFTEFTSRGREAIDTFTNEVAIDGANDFIPLGQYSPSEQRALLDERDRLSAFGQGLKRMVEGRGQQESRAVTSQLKPLDFGDLDLPHADRSELEDAEVAAKEAAEREIAQQERGERFAGVDPLVELLRDPVLAEQAQAIMRIGGREACATYLNRQAQERGLGELNITVEDLPSAF